MKNKWCDHAWSPWMGSPRVLADHWQQQEPVGWNRRPFICDRCGLALAQPQGHIGRGRKKCGTVDGDGDLDVTFHRPRVFPSLCDWLDDEVPIEWLCRFLTLIRDTPNLDWLLLTKRPELWDRRIRAAIQYNEECRMGGRNEWLSRWLSGTSPNSVWIGASVEDQAQADERIPKLLKIPAKLRFISVEPMLGPVDLSKWIYDRRTEIRAAMYGPASLNRDQAESVIPECPIRWVIVGGESGPGDRPCNVAWIRDIVRQCRSAGVPVFVKQLGAKAYEEDFAHTKECWNEDCQLSGGPEDCTGAVEREYFTLTHHKGGDPAEWPEDLRVRQMPEVKP